MDNEPMYRCTICGREGSVGRCCGDDTRIPLNDAAEKEMHDIRMRQIVHMSREALEDIKATARAEARRAAQDCNGCWLDDSKAHIACINCRRSNPDLYRTTADIILADKQEGKNA
jgi:hypothetical protein